MPTCDAAVSLDLAKDRMPDRGSRHRAAAGGRGPPGKPATATPNGTPTWPRASRCSGRPRGPAALEVGETVLRVLDRAGAGGNLLTSHGSQRRREVPPPATEPPAPKQITSNDELFITGLHLEQYRHATRCPTPYWREALRRDPGDSRVNNAMGLWHLRRGEFDQAEGHFRRAVRAAHAAATRIPLTASRTTTWASVSAINWMPWRTRSRPGKRPCFPRHTRPGQGRVEPAAGRRGAIMPWRKWIAGRRIGTRPWSISIPVVAVRYREPAGPRLEGHRPSQARPPRGGREAAARDAGPRSTGRLGPAPPRPRMPVADAQTRLDVAHDFARAGLFAEGIEVLQAGRCRVICRIRTCRRKAWGRGRSSSTRSAGCTKRPATRRPRRRITTRPPRTRPIIVSLPAWRKLPCWKRQSVRNSQDGRACYYLGNLLYDRRRHEEAIRLWAQSVKLEPALAVAWRNLGIGYFNVSKKPEKGPRGLRTGLSGRAGQCPAAARARPALEADGRLAEEAAAAVAEASRTWSPSATI